MSISTNDSPKEVLDEVMEEYEKTLVVPNHKSSPQWMLMPVGLVGSGKTTIVKPLAEHFGLIRISTDEVREQLKRRGYSYEGAREITHELQKKYLELGYSIAIDANTGSPHGLEFNKKTEEAFPQVRQLFIHINPPEEFIVNKLRNYNHTWLFKDGDHAVERFRFHKEKFTLPNLPFVYTFDTSRGDLPEQIKKGIEAIEEKLNQR
ncbi:MAG: AAA family ATPase [Patescibacteria group bacterium]